MGKTLLIIVIFATTVFSGWERTYRLNDYDIGHCVQQTYDSGYIITGVYDNDLLYGNSEVLLIKTDENGDTLWSKLYGGSYYDGGCYILQTPDSGYIIDAITFSFGAGAMDIYLIKTDKNGDTLWTKTYGTPLDDGSSSIVMTSDGGYIIAGYYNCPSFMGGAGGRAWLLKTDTNGDTLWTKTYGAPDDYDDFAESVINTADGGYIFTGRSDSSGSYSSADVYVVKTDEYGNIQWEHRYGGDDTDMGYSIKQTFDDGYVIAGFTYSFGAGSCDGYLLKINATGDTLWTKTYGGSGYDVFSSMQLTSDGGIVITGTTEELGDYYVYLIKTDLDGNELWSKKFRYMDSYGCHGYHISLTSDGGYIITGVCIRYVPPHDVNEVYLIKTDSLGNVDWVREVPQKPQNLIVSASPNPFNTSCEITVPADADVTIYDLRGNVVWRTNPSDSKERIQRTAKREWSSGTLVWTPDEEIGSGIYFIRATDGEQSITKRIVLIK